MRLACRIRPGAIALVAAATMALPAFGQTDAFGWRAQWCRYVQGVRSDVLAPQAVPTAVALTERSRLFETPGGPAALDVDPRQGWFLASADTRAALIRLQNATGRTVWADPGTVLCAPRPISDPAVRTPVRFIRSDPPHEVWAVYAIEDDAVLVGPETRATMLRPPDLRWIAESEGTVWVSGLGLRGSNPARCSAADCDHAGAFQRHDPILRFVPDGAEVLRGLGDPGSLPRREVVPHEMLRGARIDEMSNGNDVYAVTETLRATARSGEAGGVAATSTLQCHEAQRRALADKLADVIEAATALDATEGATTIATPGCTPLLRMLARIGIDRQVALSWDGGRRRFVQAGEAVHYHWLPFLWRPERLNRHFELRPLAGLTWRE